MAEMVLLRVVLKLLALYIGLMGAFALLFQEGGSFLFRYNLVDPMITRYWGALLLAMAVFYMILSLDPVKYRVFIWVGVFHLGMTLILTVVNISLKEIAWVNGIASLILNPLFIIVMLYGLAKEPEGEVIFVAGEKKKPPRPEHTLPDHITGHHPLHRK
jgi:hypothetical protein